MLCFDVVTRLCCVSCDNRDKASAEKLTKNAAAADRLIDRVSLHELLLSFRGHTYIYDVRSGWGEGGPQKADRRKYSINRL